MYPKLKHTDVPFEKIIQTYFLYWEWKLSQQRQCYVYMYNVVIYLIYMEHNVMILPWSPDDSKSTYLGLYIDTCQLFLNKDNGIYNLNNVHGT